MLGLAACSHLKQSLCLCILRLKEIATALLPSLGHLQCLPLHGSNPIHLAPSSLRIKSKVPIVATGAYTIRLPIRSLTSSPMYLPLFTSPLRAGSLRPFFLLCLEAFLPDLFPRLPYLLQVFSQISLLNGVILVGTSKFLSQPQDS